MSGLPMREFTKPQARQALARICMIFDLIERIVAIIQSDAT